MLRRSRRDDHFCTSEVAALCLGLSPATRAGRADRWSATLDVFTHHYVQARNQLPVAIWRARRTRAAQASFGARGEILPSASRIRGISTLRVVQVHAGAGSLGPTARTRRTKGRSASSNQTFIRRAALPLGSRLRQQRDQTAAPVVRVAHGTTQGDPEHRDPGRPGCTPPFAMTFDHPSGNGFARLLVEHRHPADTGTHHCRVIRHTTARRLTPCRQARRWPCPHGCRAAWNAAAAPTTVDRRYAARLTASGYPGIVEHCTLGMQRRRSRGGGLPSGVPGTRRSGRRTRRSPHPCGVPA